MKTPADKIVSIGEAADILHVSPETLRRYETEGRLGFEVMRTPGGHRKYHLSDLLAYKKGLGGPENIEHLIKLPSAKLSDQEVLETIEKFKQQKPCTANTPAQAKTQLAQKELGLEAAQQIVHQFDAQTKTDDTGFMVDTADEDLEIGGLYDKYTFTGDDGKSHLPQPHEMTDALFCEEYNFMSFADLESPLSFEWLARLKEEMARRLEIAGLPGAGEQRYGAKRLRRDAYSHFGHEQTVDVLTFPI